MLSCMINTNISSNASQDSVILFYLNDLTDYIVIQHTFKDNVENKALLSS